MIITETKYQNIFQYKKSKNKWKSFAILIIGVILTILAVIYTQKAEEKLQKLEFANECIEIKAKINTRLLSHAQLLRSGSSFFAASDTITRKAWKKYYDTYKINKNLPGIQGFGFSYIIPKNKLQEHIQTIRNEGFPHYTVRPVGNREIYTSIIYLEPFTDRNLRAFGYDMYSEAVRRKAMEKARDYDVAALSGKVILVQETDKDLQAGTLMYVPVYRNGMPTNTIKERRKAIIGWVYSPYRMHDLMNGILGRWDNFDDNRIRLQVFDNDSISQNSLLFDSQRKNPNNLNNIPKQKLTIPIVFNEKKWTLLFTQSNKQNKYFQSKVLIILVSGLLISFLLFSLSLALFNTRIKAQKIAEKLTADLFESEKRFENYINSTSDIVFALDTEQRHVGIYGDWAERAGLSKQFFLGKTSKEILGENSTIHEQANQRALKGEHVIYQWKNTINNLTTYYQTSLSPLYKGSKIIGIIGIGRDITELIETEEALKKAKQQAENSEKLIRSISDNLVNGMIYQVVILNEKNRKFTYISDNVEKYYGCTAQQAIENPNLIYGRVHPDDIQQLIDYEIEALKTMSEFKTEVRLKRDDNNYRWALLISKPRKYNDLIYWDGIEFNITELKQTQEALLQAKQRAEESEKRFSLFMDFLPAIVFLKDDEGRTLFVNKYMDNALGASAWIGKNMFEVIPNDFGAKLLADDKRVIKKGYEKIEESIHFFDGIEHFFETQKFIIPQQTGETFLGGISLDITERRKMELILKEKNEEIATQNEELCQINEELKYTKEEIEKSNEKLIQLNTDKDRFISILAHDLKSPFNAILGFLDLLTKNVRKYDIDKIEQQLNIVNNSAKTTFHLLEEILMWIRASSGKIPYEPQKLDFHLICSDVIEKMKLTANTKEISLNSFVPPETCIFADKSMVNTILRNLISNAIKFTHKNGSIDIHSETSQSDLTITVSDTGIGMDDKTVSKLFNISQSITTEGTANEKGTGLGLLLCKEFVEKHGGRIWVESVLGKGSNFKFTIPMCNDLTI